MDFLSILRALLALIVTLGLIVLIAAAVKKYAPGLLARLQARGTQSGQRRMQVLETVVLGPTQRLLLVKVDAEERLILLGEGREIEKPERVA